MKYPRQHKIYTGHLDLGSAAGVFFLLLTFVVLSSSLVFTPGLRVALPAGDDLGRLSIVQLAPLGQVTFQDQSFTLDEFTQRLRTEAVDPKRQLVYRVQLAHGVKDEHVRKLQMTADDLGLRLRFSKPGIELPIIDNVPGSTNPVVVVAVAYNGQIFYDNQVTREERLKAQLKSAKAKTPGPLTLVIEADKDVKYATILRLAMMAREAGLEEVLMGGRPNAEPLSAALFE